MEKCQLFRGYCLFDDKRIGWYIWRTIRYVMYTIINSCNIIFTSYNPVRNYCIVKVAVKIYSGVVDSFKCNTISVFISSSIMWRKAALRIRIGFNADPNPDPSFLVISDPGFYWPKLQNFYSWKYSYFKNHQLQFFVPRPLDWTPSSLDQAKAEGFSLQQRTSILKHKIS